MWLAPSASTLPSRPSVRSYVRQRSCWRSVRRPRPPERAMGTRRHRELHHALCACAAPARSSHASDVEGSRLLEPMCLDKSHGHMPTSSLHRRYMMEELDVPTSGQGAGHRRLHRQPAMHGPAAPPAAKRTGRRSLTLRGACGDQPSNTATIIRSSRAYFMRCQEPRHGVGQPASTGTGPAPMHACSV